MMVYNRPMRRIVLSTFLFVAILGLGCMGVAVPGKAEELKHPIVLQGKCKRSFDAWLDLARYNSTYYFSSFAYVQPNTNGVVACAWGYNDKRAIERCNERKVGECKVYAKTPVDETVAIVWEEGKTGQRGKTSSENNRYTSSQDKKHIRQLCKKFGRDHIWGGPRYGNIDCRRTVLAKTHQRLRPCPGSYSKSTWSNCFGAYTFASGDKYVGEWRNGKYHG